MYTHEAALLGELAEGIEEKNMGIKKALSPKFTLPRNYNRVYVHVHYTLLDTLTKINVCMNTIE